MKARIDEGGTAFPSVGADDPADYGMFLRDYFAAKAMPAMLSAYVDRPHPQGIDGIAQLAYKVADAMLKEKDKV